MKEEFYTFVSRNSPRDGPQKMVRSIQSISEVLTDIDYFLKDRKFLNFDGT